MHSCGALQSFLSSQSGAKFKLWQCSEQFCNRALVQLTSSSCDTPKITIQDLPVEKKLTFRFKHEVLFRRRAMKFPRDHGTQHFSEFGPITAQKSLQQFTWVNSLSIAHIANIDFKVNKSEPSIDFNTTWMQSSSGRKIQKC